MLEQIEHLIESEALGRLQVLTLSGEKMGFEGTLEGFERRGEPGKEW